MGSHFVHLQILVNLKFLFNSIKFFKGLQKPKKKKKILYLYHNFDFCPCFVLNIKITYAVADATINRTFKKLRFLNIFWIKNN